MNKDLQDMDWEPADLDRLIEEIATDADGEDEQLRAFLCAINDEDGLPGEGCVMGEHVSVMAIDYDGHPRRGLTARCRRADGSEHAVAASEVVMAPDLPGAKVLAAYRRWLGLDPLPKPAPAPIRPRPQPKVGLGDLDLSRPVELVVLAVKQQTVRCRPVGDDRVITIRPSGWVEVAPGEIAVIKPRKQWRYAGHPYLSGEIESVRLDIPALGLVPLQLESREEWTPEEHYWGEPEDPIEEWAKPIIARGPRPSFEMEQVLPGHDPSDPDSDPICRSNDLWEAGDHAAAYKILMGLCLADLRCLDAHAHLGNFVFQHSPQEAIRHFEAGVRIGELSLAPDFDGLLQWLHIDNRPYLRCLKGYGLCLWRLRRFEEAGQVFERMLWLNPADNQGVRALIDAVGSRMDWERASPR